MSNSDDQAFSAVLQKLQQGQLTYDEVKHFYGELGDAIRQRYEREFTALSIDVVGSRELKSTGNDLEAQLTFDAYHAWVEEKLDSAPAFRYTWSGDGLFAVFEEPALAVRVGQWLLDQLPDFNLKQNRLRRPLAIRIGAHTGPVLPSDGGGPGRIASRTFDLAGHLQKAALANQMLISETTYMLLRQPGGKFAPVQREMPNQGPAFAYPPHTATIPPGYFPPVPQSPGPAAGPPPAYGTATMTGYPGTYSGHAEGYPPPPAQGPPHDPAWYGATPAPARAPVPWAWIGGAGVLGVAVVAGALLWPRMQTQGQQGRPQAAPGFQQQPTALPSPPGAGMSGAAPGGVQPVPVQPGAAGGHAPAPGLANRAVSPDAGAAVPRRPPAWNPSMRLWRSAEAVSGVPGRIIPSEPQLRWLLAIGVGRYRAQDYRFERGAEGARLAAQAIARAAGVPSDHVLLLTDEQATLDGIRQAFVQLQQRATSGRDTVYVYLAGDAAAVPDPPGIRHPNGHSYAFLPADADPKNLAQSVVYGPEIGAWLGAMRAQTVVLFADTPLAGSIDVPGTPDSGRQYVLVAGTDASGRPAARGGAVPVFTEALAAGLQGTADANGDRRVLLRELTDYLGREVPARSGNVQTPRAVPGFGGYLPDLAWPP